MNQKILGALFRNGIDFIKSKDNYKIKLDSVVQRYAQRPVTQGTRVRFPATASNLFFFPFFFIHKRTDYFFNHLQTLKYFLKLANIFLEFIEALQNPQSFRIFFQFLTKTLALPEVVQHFSRISRCPTKSPKLQNIFSSIYKHSSTS